MAKKQKGPQYIPSALNTPMLNYREYYMSAQEKIITFLTAFIVGGVAGLAFYGNQFIDADGAATSATTICNVITFIAIGLLSNFIYFPMRTKQLRDKRKMILTQQFRSLLDALAVCLSSGMNMSDSLSSALSDLKMEYGNKAPIVKEVTEMVSGLQNNIPIEKMMKDFGERSEIEDIKNFAVVFQVAYRAGGNIKDIVRRTNAIISEKIEISEEIETAISSNKSQFTAMMVIPVVMMVLLRTMSSNFAKSFATPLGIFAITAAIGIFVGAYKLGQKIMDVKG